VSLSKQRGVALGVLALAAIVGVVIIIAGGGAEPETGPDDPAPPSEPRADPFFGVNESFLYQSQQLGQQALADAHAAAMAGAGVEWVRLSTAWRGEEPNPPIEGQHVYDWTFLDGAIRTLASNRLPFALSLFTTPNWAVANADDIATCGAASAPGNFEGLADYSAAVATRYGADGDFWQENADLEEVSLYGIEVWNEPNWNAFWCPEPQPEAFAEAFVESAEAIGEVDPDIRLVTGGLTSVFEDGEDVVSQGMDANEFMRRAVAHRPEIAKLADAIGFHPYAPDVAGVLDHVEKFRSGLEEVGLGDVPIEISEAGWPTQGPAYAVDEAERTNLLPELAKTAWTTGCNVDGLAIYAWRTPESAPGQSDLWYGIADPATAEPYESADAFASEIAQLREEKRPDFAGQPCG